MISLLNALLPLDDDGQIESVEYIPVEQVPRTPTRKNSIVDVKCKDMRGRRFIVEMQMSWSEEFKYCVVFNAAKAYVGQIDRGENYELLQPVYSLNLVNDIFENDVDDFYHYYRFVHDKYTKKVIDGLHLVFVELPKFKPQTFTEKRMTALWLRFLTEIHEKTQEVPAELLEDDKVSRAIELVEESAFTPAEMEAYDKFWDDVRVEKALLNEARRQREKGYKEGIVQGIEKGIKEGIKATARKMLMKGLSLKDIAELTGLKEEEIEI